MYIIDSHCHLNLGHLATDIPGVLARADQANVKLVLTVCTKVSDAAALKDITEKHDNVYCSIGVHPHEVEQEGVIPVDRLIELTMHPKVIGIGETGLDYYYEHSNRVVQRESLINHIAAARVTGLPIIIHNRSSDQDMIEILRTEMAKGVFTGVLHCFSSSAELAAVALELGMYISISGIVTFKSAQDLRAIVKTLPLERLLVETDSPYLAPEPQRGTKNEPAFIKHTVEYLAVLLDKNPEEIANITTENFFKLFQKVSE